MTDNSSWDLLVLDGKPPVKQLGALTTGDLDNDGHKEVLVGGEGGLLWYRPDTFEKGIVSPGHLHVGLALEDVDGDGIKEVFCGLKDPDKANQWMIVWFKPGVSLDQPWTMHVIDATCNGGAHDVYFADIDGDGQNELLANTAYCKVPGIFIYKPGQDLNALWHKHEVMTGTFSEGIAVSDLDGDGRMEIIGGPYWLNMPDSGPYAGPWTLHSYGQSFREMCRVEAIDITGSGHADLILTDSEYMDGKLSWFENRLVEEPDRPWIEHRIEDTPVIYAHSLNAWHENGAIKVFMGEMAQGGWNPPYNWDARLIEYTSSDKGHSWEREVIYRGAGTHEADVVDLDGDGVVEVVGKECWRPKVTIWKPRKGAKSPIGGYQHVFIDRDKPMSGTDIIAADVDGDGRQDVICARYWYRNPTWQRYEIPGIFQVICAYDLDGDGQDELIATKMAPEYDGSNLGKGLSSELVWLKGGDPVKGAWTEYPIGTGVGDWPHGNAVAPLLPGGKLALITSYHSANQGKAHFPELFEIPDDPTSVPWLKRTLAEIVYGEEMIPVDITGNGTLDIVAGPYWLENGGDGSFAPHRFVGDDHFYSARLRVTDLNGNARPDVILGEEVLDFQNKVVPFSQLAWFECPEDSRAMSPGPCM